MNVEQLGIHDFLDKAETQFFGQIRKVLKQDNAVKVNTIHKGEFSVVKNDEELSELKTFNTANIPIP